MSADSTQSPSSSAVVQQGQVQNSHQGESLVPFYTQLTPIHTSHSATTSTDSTTQGAAPTPTARGGRKRKASGTGGTTNGKVVHLKQEPGKSKTIIRQAPLLQCSLHNFHFWTHVGFAAEITSSDSNCSNNGGGNNGNSVDDDYGFDFSGDPSMFLDSNYQCIKFQPFQENTWHTLADETFKEL